MAVKAADKARDNLVSRGVSAADDAVGTQRVFDDVYMTWREDQVDPFIPTHGRLYGVAWDGMVPTSDDTGHTLNDGSAITNPPPVNPPSIGFSPIIPPSGLEPAWWANYLSGRMPSDHTFLRNSTATYVSDEFIYEDVPTGEWAPTGPELIVHPGTLNSGWVYEGGDTYSITGGAINAALQFTGDDTLTTGDTIWCMVEVISLDSQSLKFRGGAASDADFEATGPGVYSFALTGLILSANLVLQVLAGNNGTTATVRVMSIKKAVPVTERVNTGALKVKTAAVDEPRFEYESIDNGDGTYTAEPLGLLIEPAGENLVTYSDQFDDASWNPSSSPPGVAPVVTPNVGTAPDGSKNADRVFFDKTDDTANSQSRLIQNVSVTGEHTFSVWMKSADGTDYEIGLESTGTRKTVTVTSEWQRFDVNRTSDGSNVQIKVITGSTANSTADVYLWGAQCEVGPNATSYIPTTGTTKTRAADICTADISSVDLSVQGTMFVEWHPKDPVNTSPRVLEYSDTGDGLRIASTSNAIARVYYDNGVSNAGAGTTDAEVTRHAWANTGVAHNGLITNAAFPSNPFATAGGDISVGSRLVNGASQINGHIRRIQLWGEALPDTDLQAITL